MAKDKFDGVVIAVHNTSEGAVDWVRMFLRRGPTFSDRTMVSREQLIERVNAGERILTGTRVVYEGTTFKTGDKVSVVKNNGEEFLVVGDAQATSRDNMRGVPVL